MTVVHLPTVAEAPTVDELAGYLSMTGVRSPEVDAMLGDAINGGLDYELGRASYARMIESGADPPSTMPGPVARAVLMRAAALYRRRNSVNGFDGYDDLGTVPVRASDPDIERLVDPWRAWSWA